MIGFVRIAVFEKIDQMIAESKSVEELQKAVGLRHTWEHIVKKDDEVISAIIASLLNKQEEKQKEKPKNTPIEDLGLSYRAYNCIKRAGINTAEELENTDDEKLMKIRNLGMKCFLEIKAILKDREEVTQ